VQKFIAGSGHDDAAIFQNIAAVAECMKPSNYEMPTRPSSVLTISKRAAVRNGCLHSGGVTGMFCNSTISISASFMTVLLIIPTIRNSIALNS